MESHPAWPPHPDLQMALSPPSGLRDPHALASDPPVSAGPRPQTCFFLALQVVLTRGWGSELQPDTGTRHCRDVSRAREALQQWPWAEVWATPATPQEPWGEEERARWSGRHTGGHGFPQTVFRAPQTVGMMDRGWEWPPPGTFQKERGRLHGSIPLVEEMPLETEDAEAPGGGGAGLAPLD